MSPLLSWTESDLTHTALWRSENGSPPPKRVIIADDRIAADTAYRLACEGTALLWRGDFQNARQLMLAMARRTDRKPRKEASNLTDAFNFHRQAQSQRARVLGMLLIPFEANHHIPLRRAPDVQLACQEAYGTAEAPYVTSLREVLGLIGAHEWHKKGVEISTLKGMGDGRIYPHYGVFSPVRGEYIDLVNQAPLPSTELAFDIGTGTGVLAAVLAKRGIKRIIATELDTRALTCAKDNLSRLGLNTRIEVQQADLFPEGRAPLIVCNPPWVPARPSSAIEHAVYDPDSKMLRGFLNGLTAHLAPQGEGWLILSDIAEHLGLRSREALLAMIETAGLHVIDRLDVRPRHSRAADKEDPLHAARAAEVTSLWRLGAK